MANNQDTIVYTYTVYDKWLYNEYVNTLNSSTIAQSSYIDLSKISVVFYPRDDQSNIQTVVLGSGSLSITNSFASGNQNFYVDITGSLKKINLNIAYELVTGRTPTNGIPVKYLKFTLTITKFTMINASGNLVEGCARVNIDAGLVTDDSGLSSTVVAPSDNGLNSLIADSNFTPFVIDNVAIAQDKVHFETNDQVNDDWYDIVAGTSTNITLQTSSAYSDEWVRC